MANQNYRQIFGRLAANKKRILKISPTLQEKSGIYLFYRADDSNNKNNCVYIGQSTSSVLARCANHLDGWRTKNPTHIDLSLKSHGLYSPTNQYGWKVCVLQYCEPSRCDSLEKLYINYYLNKENIIVYNITGGGQGKGKEDIAERNETNLKRYRSGSAYGYAKAIKEIKIFFDKYLDYTIKGKPTKIKERKLQEFKELISRE